MAIVAHGILPSTGLLTTGLLATGLLAAGCERPGNELASASPCGPVDPVLADTAFVVVTKPSAGARLSSPFEVTGCSRTFESTINWVLRARDGSELASGYALGGGVDGAAGFAFSVSYAAESTLLGHLEVFEVDASGGEGFAPSRSVIPVVLEAGQ